MGKKIKKTGWQTLEVGDTVDVVAPGFSIPPEKLEAAREFLTKLGLKPRIPANIFGDDFLCAQTDKVRYELLKKALLATDSKAVWCVRGGYGAIRMIEQIAKLKKPRAPKIFIGYSDSTTLHNFFNQFWGWPTLHGPLLDRLGQHTLPVDQVQECLDVIFGRQDKVTFKGLKPMNAAARKKNKISASVAGGNLTVTQSHLGTKFYRPPRGQILFFEDLGERGYRVDRMLFHLEMAGYFKAVKAIVFGDFLNSDEPTGQNLVPQVLARFAETQKIPVFGGLEVGHGAFQRTLPLATSATLVCGATGELTVATGATLK